MKTLCSFFLFLLFTFTGCRQATPTVSSANPATAQDSSTINRVCKVAAKQMGLTISDVTPDTSLADLGADELDLVELVMQLEEEFDQPITDEAIAGVTASDASAGYRKLTMSNLAALVDSPKMPTEITANSNSIAKVSVMVDGTVYLNSEVIPIDSFGTKLDALGDIKEIWYHREAPEAAEPHENAMKAITEIANRGLPVAMYLDREFTQRANFGG